MSEYKNAINTAEQILKAHDCKYDEEYGWLFVLNDELAYRKLDEKTAESVINEALGYTLIDWFDEEVMDEGIIEVNGTVVAIYFNDSQKDLGY
ncbi:hypothetical protein FJ364_02835 [Candidatus Dependentiae bacterium]|nr:hypothetical protein [Candidatus Dependentiae bacterium]